MTETMMKTGFSRPGALRAALGATALTLAFALPAFAIGVTADGAASAAIAPSAGVPPSAGAGQENGSATALISGMGQQALNFLRDKSMGQAGKAAAFRDLLQNSFDMQTIGRFTAGQYWRQMSPAQQQDYQNLFREYVVKVYSARFDQYKGQDFKVTGTAPSDTPTDTIVTSVITSPQQAQPVDVNWRVRSESNGYKIVDVLVEGVSMSQTQRSDFASVIQQGGGNVNTLLQKLHQQVGQ